MKKFYLILAIILNVNIFADFESEITNCENSDDQKCVFDLFRVIHKKLLDNSSLITLKSGLYKNSVSNHVISINQEEEDIYRTKGFKNPLWDSRYICINVHCEQEGENHRYFTIVNSNSFYILENGLPTKWELLK